MGKARILDVRDLRYGVTSSDCGNAVTVGPYNAGLIGRSRGLAVWPVRTIEVTAASEWLDPGSHFGEAGRTFAAKEARYLNEKGLEEEQGIVMALSCGEA